jgi:hypothetical protein
MNTRAISVVIVCVVMLALTSSVRDPAVAAPGGMNVSIMAYGARGDGIVDDTAAIQRALDAVGAAGGGTVTIPPGTYRVAARPREDRLYPIVLRLHSNVAIVGSGAASVIRLDVAPENYDTVWILATCDARKSWCAGPTRNVRLENLVLDGSRLRQPRKAGRESEHMHGVMLVSASDVQIRRMVVRDVAGDGIYTYRENSRVVVEQSTFQRIRRVAINFAGASDSVARDNSIDGAQWALKMELDGSAERSVANNEFRGNSARNVFGGISITKADESQLATHARASGMTIADNTFEITGAFTDRIGILLWGVDRVRVTGNRITGNLMQGLAAWEDVTELLIQNNVFSVALDSPGASAGSAACVRLGGRDASEADVRGVTIRGNTLAACRVGVRLTKPGRFQLVGVTIADNMFVENLVAGILVESRTGIVNLSIGSNTFRQTPNPIVRH